jgi:hypothetical protein
MHHPLIPRNLGQGRTLLPKHSRERVHAVRISGEPSVFMQPDVDPSNFGRDEHGNAVIMDFGQIAPLPQSFAAFTIFSNPRLAPFAESLGLANNANVASMIKISGILWMMSDERLGTSTCSHGISTTWTFAVGLNNDGFPEVS